MSKKVFNPGDKVCVKVVWCGFRRYGVKVGSIGIIACRTDFSYSTYASVRIDGRSFPMELDEIEPVLSSKLIDIRRKENETNKLRQETRYDSGKKAR